MKEQRYDYLTTGLSDKDVAKSKEMYGTNQLTSTKQDGFFKQFITTLGDPIIRILLIALAIKTVFLFSDFDWYETIGIVIAIFLASFISTISEYGSEKAFEKLQEESSKIRCKILRNSKIVNLPIDDIVVGDIVLLQAGDKVPADGILKKGSLSIDESSLNGETKEIYKEAMKKGLNPQEINCLYRGTVVYSQEGIMEVTKVGNQTFYGKLALEIQEKQPDSPLKIRLRGLAKIISRIGYVSAILVSLSYLFSVIVIDNKFNSSEILLMLKDIPLLTGHVLYALTLSVTIIVVAVPEGCRQVRWRSNIRAKRYVSLSGTTRDGGVLILLFKKL